MELWLRANTTDNARNAYKIGYVMGSRAASPVDVMRWDARFHYAAFRASEAGRKITADANAAKLGFLDGFAAAQNRKALSAAAPFGSARATHRYQSY
jgi:hypothetical protein